VASLIENIRDFLRNNIAGDQAAGDPPVPGKIDDIGNLLSKLGEIELSPGNNGLTNWLDTLTELFDVALRETLIVRALQLKAPRLTEALVLVGLIEVEFLDETPRAHSFRIDWNKIDAFLRDPGGMTLATLLSRIQKIDDLKAAQAMTGLWLTSPRTLLLLEYAEQGYASLPDPNPAGVIDLNQLVEDLINSPLKLGLPVTPPLDLAALRLKAQQGAGLADDYVAILGPNVFNAQHPLDGFGLEIKLKDPAGMEFSQDLGGGLRFVASAAGTGVQTYRLVMKNEEFDRTQASTATLEAGLAYQPAGGKAMIGPPDGTRFEIGPAKLIVRLQPDSPPGAPLFTMRAALESAAFVFSTGALGLLKNIAQVPDEVRFESQMALSFVHGAGLQGGGGAGLPPISTAYTVPLNLKLGGAGIGLAIERVNVEMAIKVAGNGLMSKVSLRFGASGNFGPVNIVADGMGAWFGNWDGAAGGIEKPTMIGVSLDAGPVSGGGFLAKVGENDYAGGLSLKVIGIGVGAFGLFGEADGTPSFVTILGIRLPFPGVQISFGFAITGVGGLVGINRRVDTDVLREQLATGTSGDILFCADPSKNALTVIGQLPRLFPAERGVFLIGPTFQISWLELLKLDAGVFIEMPGPRQIFMAGSARLIIGSEEFALVYLRMDFVGGIDLVKKLLYFDAALVNSHVMQVFKITGGIALRLAYGDNGYFLFSVGGFNASFNPGGLELPKLARAGVCTSVAIAWFKLENYFALTSNTFQIGAAVEAGIELGPISAHGWLRFDALIQFDPFYFVAAIDAGFDVEVFGVSLCGVRVQGKLSGPGPLVVEARATVKVLFAKASESVTIKLGSGPAPVPRAIDLLQTLAGEFAKPENTRADGQDTSVVLRNDRATVVNGAAVVQAVGAVIWEQKRVPFSLDLQRFEGTPLSGKHRLMLSCSDAAAGEERDWFGMGTYLNLSESEALNNGRFTEAQSGIRIPLDEALVGNGVDCPVELDLIKLPKRSRIAILAAGYMSAGLATMQHQRTGVAVMQPGKTLVTASQEKWKVVAANGGSEGLSGAQAFLAQRGGAGLAQPSTAVAVGLGGVL
jgi:hypothetical protein